jgi:hypothetical protein
VGGRQTKWSSWLSGRLDSAGLGPPDRLPLVLLLGLVVLGYGPLLFLGPGTDIDTFAVIESGRSIVGEGPYVVSRNPGAPVHEAAVGVLHAVGGTVATNLGTLVVALAGLVALWRMLRGAGVAHAGWWVLVVAAHPHVWIASTSTIDFMWALGFLLLGTERLFARRPLPATAWFVLAVGCRGATLLLVAAALAAHALGDRERAAEGVRVGAATVVLSALLFVPAWLAADRSFAFLQNELAVWSGLVLQGGRSIAKHLFFFGVPLLVVLLALAPGLVGAVRSRWRRSALLRFAVLAGVVTEAIFLWLPWKLAHLLPLVVVLIVVLGHSRWNRREIAIVILTVQLVTAVVTVHLVRPDTPDQATGAEWAPALDVGPLVRDVRCRLEDRSRSPQLPPPERAFANWSCALAFREP